MKILHITAHMGGGVGKVLSGVATQDKKNEHSILCLEATQSAQFEDVCRQANIPVFLYDSVDFQDLCQHYDILQIEWWHHPLMAKFLTETLENIPARVVVWSHISGCNYPRLPISFIKEPTDFVFASPYSYENPSWTEEERAWVKVHKRVVVSSGSDFQNLQLEKQAHEAFRVGYIGFLGYEKIHHQFAKVCQSVLTIPGVELRVGGDLQHAEQLLQNMQALGIYEDVQFLGYLNHVYDELSGLDVFLYPLSQTNTGTAENALLEAMAAGVVPVVLDQCSEKYTVQHMKTGLVAQNIEECSQLVKWLMGHPEERLKIGRAAAQHVKEHYTLEKTIAGLSEIYAGAMEKQKEPHKFSEIMGSTPFEWFTHFYAGDLEHIEGMAWGESKGSIKQYNKYFPDEALQSVILKNQSAAQEIQESIMEGPQR